MSMFDQLAAPFPPEQVSWRVGSTNSDKTKGLALAYLDARDVMERLDSVVGPGSWQCRYPHANGKTVCEIGIRVDGEWIWKADGSGDTDVEAEKGALSDAFKRAAVRWGIGRYLYDLGNTWAEIEPMGRSFKIKASEYQKLRRQLPNAPKNSAPAQPARAEQAGGELSPLASPSADVAYVSLAKTAIQNATSVEELDQWWKDESASRKANGVEGGIDRTTGEVAGTPAYLDLAKAFSARKSDLTKRAA